MPDWTWLLFQGAQLSKFTHSFYCIYIHSYRYSNPGLAESATPSKVPGKPPDTAILTLPHFIIHRLWGWVYPSKHWMSVHLCKATYILASLALPMCWFMLATQMCLWTWAPLPPTGKMKFTPLDTHKSLSTVSDKTKKQIVCFWSPLLHS